MANSLQVELLAGAERSSPGSGSAVDIGALRSAAIVEVVSAPVVGPPNVTLGIETRLTETAPWRGAAREIIDGSLIVGGLDRYIRALWELDAGATVYVAVNATAHVLYCEPQHIPQLSLPSQALCGVEQRDLLAGCIAISEIADGYLNGSFQLPLAVWGASLRMQCAKLVAAHVLSVRGTDPDGPDSLVFDAAKAATRWFERIADGKLKPPEIIDSTPEEFEGGSVVVSTPGRGW